MHQVTVSLHSKLVVVNKLVVDVVVVAIVVVVCIFLSSEAMDIALCTV